MCRYLLWVPLDILNGRCFFAAHSSYSGYRIRCTSHELRGSCSTGETLNTVTCTHWCEYSWACSFIVISSLQSEWAESLSSPEDTVTPTNSFLTLFMIANTKCCIYCMRELHWQTQTPDTRWGFRLFVGRSDPMTSSMSLGDPNRRTRPSNPFKTLRLFFPE